MPYASNGDLPLSVRGHLPQHGQDIFRDAFNHAWVTYGVRKPWQREATAHRVAWAAVKRKYRKAGNEWVAIPSPAVSPGC
jgi:cation transport regulator